MLQQSSASSAGSTFSSVTAPSLLRATAEMRAVYDTWYLAPDRAPDELRAFSAIMQQLRAGATLGDACRSAMHADPAQHERRWWATRLGELMLCVMEEPVALTFSEEQAVARRLVRAWLMAAKRLTSPPGTCVPLLSAQLSREICWNAHSAIPLST